MTVTFAAATLSIALVVSTAAVETPRSAVLARDLAAALTAKGLDAIATQYPNQPDRFVAALYFQGAQLLVVDAHHPSPESIHARLQHQQFRDAYIELQGTADRASRWFLQDMSADGLCGARNQAADILYQGAETTVVFDGDWKKHDVPEQEYSEKWSAAEHQYDRLLELLLAQIGRT
jgi:hypothetical protein